MLSKKLSARKEFIEKMIKQEVGRLEWAARRQGHTGDDIKAYLEDVLDTLCAFFDVNPSVMLSRSVVARVWSSRTRGRPTY